MAICASGEKLLQEATGIYAVGGYVAYTRSLKWKWAKNVSN